MSAILSGMDKDDVRMRVLNGLTELIIQHSGMTAAEQYMPSRTADQMDEYVESHKKWVVELREIRRRFENLITGIIDVE